jgi:hypothetical protein
VTQVGVSRTAESSSEQFEPGPAPASNVPQDLGTRAQSLAENRLVPSNT